MTDPRDFDIATLLRHLGCELARLAETADQHAAAALARASGGLGTEELVALQTMDALTQVLRDLQRLANAAAASPLGRHPADAGFIRRNLLLQSLAGRLVHGPGHDRGHDPQGFLL